MSTSNSQPSSAEQVAVQFFEAFQNGDGAKMAALYGDGATFSDPVFGKLSAQDAGDMWRMLCSRALDLQVDFKVASFSERFCVVLWEANYTFMKTGRLVRNKIKSKITVSEGKIMSHEDQFCFWSWAWQALGLKGLLFGWSSFLREPVQKGALASLALYQSSTTKGMSFLVNLIPEPCAAPEKSSPTAW